MEKHEKKPELILSEEQMRRAIQSMKGKDSPTDTDNPFSGEIRKEVVEKLHELYRRRTN